VKQSMKAKCTEGVLLFVVLVVLIWFPLLLLSSGSPTNVPNLVSKLNVQLGSHGNPNSADT
jgi:hypothetical protein